MSLRRIFHHFSTKKFQVYFWLVVDCRHLTPYSLSTEKDIGFLRVSCVPLEAAIRSETSSWVHSIGKLLHTSVKANLDELIEAFSRVENDLSRIPDTMDDLKFILNVIDQVSDICQMSRTCHMS